MDYGGLYHDLSEMERRVLNAIAKAERRGEDLYAVSLDALWVEVQQFMDEIVTRKW